MVFHLWSRAYRPTFTDVFNQPSSPLVQQITGHKCRYLRLQRMVAKRRVHRLFAGDRTGRTRRSRDGDGKPTNGGDGDAIGGVAVSGGCDGGDDGAEVATESLLQPGEERIVRTDLEVLEAHARKLWMLLHEQLSSSSSSSSPLSDGVASLGPAAPPPLCPAAAVADLPHQLRPSSSGSACCRADTAVHPSWWTARTWAPPASSRHLHLTGGLPNTHNSVGAVAGVDDGTAVCHITPAQERILAELRTVGTTVRTLRDILEAATDVSSLAPGESVVCVVVVNARRLLCVCSWSEAKRSEAAATLRDTRHRACTGKKTCTGKTPQQLCGPDSALHPSIHPSIHPYARNTPPQVRSTDWARCGRWQSTKRSAGSPFGGPPTQSTRGRCRSAPRLVDCLKQVVGVGVGVFGVGVGVFGVGVFGVATDYYDRQATTSRGPRKRLDRHPSIDALRRALLGVSE